MKPYFGIETLSWICILGVVPFAAIGFIKYNGMTFEKFIIAFIKQKILLPNHLLFIPTNYYEELFNQERNKKHEKIKKRKRNI